MKPINKKNKMTYIEALYGSQYYEITNKGKNAAAGRLNGNLLLSVFILITFFLVVKIISIISSDFSLGLDQFLSKLFGKTSGKTIGKLLSIPLIGIIYLIVIKTIGSANNYEKITKKFNSYPTEEKEKANKQILMPFLISLASLIFFSLIF